MVWDLVTIGCVYVGFLEVDSCLGWEATCEELDYEGEKWVGKGWVSSYEDCDNMEDWTMG